MCFLYIQITVRQYKQAPGMAYGAFNALPIIKQYEVIFTFWHFSSKAIKFSRVGDKNRVSRATGNKQFFFCFCLMLPLFNDVTETMITLCLKSPSVRGFVASLPVRLLFKYLPHNAFCPVSSLPQWDWADESGHNVLYYTYLNNMRTGKYATKPRTMGLFGHSGYM